MARPIGLLAGVVTAAAAGARRTDSAEADSFRVFGSFGDDSDNPVSAPDGRAYGSGLIAAGPALTAITTRTATVLREE